MNFYDALTNVKQFKVQEYIGGIVTPLKNVIEKGHPSVIISFAPEATAIILEAVGDEIPIIKMLHSCPTEILESITERSLNALKKSSVIQVLRPEFIEYMKNIYNTKDIIDIPNPVPQLKIACELTEKSAYNIIHCGRLDGKSKRQHLL